MNSNMRKMYTELEVAEISKEVAKSVILQDYESISIEEQLDSATQEYELTDEMKEVVKNHKLFCIVLDDKIGESITTAILIKDVEFPIQNVDYDGFPNALIVIKITDEKLFTNWAIQNFSLSIKPII